MTVMPYEAPDPLPASAPGDELALGPVGWVARLRAAAEIAGYIGDTDFVPVALRGNRAAIAAAILYGDEVGLTPMQSLARIAVIHGTPTLRAEAMRALVVSKGHEIWLDEATATRAIAAGRRSDSERVLRVVWTMDDAKRAGLAGKEPYRRYPREMLVARATAMLCRQVFADVVGGLAAAEELEDEPESQNGPTPVPDTTGSSPPEPDEPRPTRTRQRKPREPEPEAARAPLAPTPPPDAQPEPPVDPATDPPATDARKRQMFALMRDVGFGTDDREERIAYTARVIGRTIESSNELTMREASMLVDALTELKQLAPDERAAYLRGAVSPVEPAEPPADPDVAPDAPDPPPSPDAPASGQRDDIPF